MKVAITDHEPVSADSLELHRFRFTMDDDNGYVMCEIICLRTAQALAAVLEDGNAFVKMIRVIGGAQSADHQALIGQTFEDNFVANTDQRRRTNYNDVPAAGTAVVSGSCHIFLSIEDAGRVNAVVVAAAAP